MLVELRERYRLQRCVIVGDRGLVSADVIRALTEAGYEYIVALRARQSKTAVAAVEAEQHNWEAVDDNLFVQEVQVENADRVLLALNDDKQDVDRRWREQLLERAWEALDALIERWDSGPTRRRLIPAIAGPTTGA
jgi:cell division GTPase FtsZ